MFDKELAMKELGIDEEMLVELLGDLMNDLNSNVPKLKDAVSQSNWDDAAKMAHFVKGASGNLRVNDMHIAAKELEALIKEAGDKDLIQTKLNDLLATIEDLKQTMNLN